MGDRAGPERSSPVTLLAMRLAPMYVWLAIMFAQPHKEERFMYPIYPLICFNGAVTIYLVRGWMEVAYVSITKSPYRVSSLSFPARIRTNSVPASRPRLRSSSADLLCLSCPHPSSFPSLARLRNGSTTTRR